MDVDIYFVVFDKSKIWNGHQLKVQFFPAFNSLGNGNLSFYILPVQTDQDEGIFKFC